MPLQLNSKITNLPESMTLVLQRDPHGAPQMRYGFTLVDESSQTSSRYQLWGDTCQQITGDLTLTEETSRTLQHFVSLAHECIRLYIDGEIGLLEFRRHAFSSMANDKFSPYVPSIGTLITRRPL